jgi:biopolymer transport protein TolQ
VTLGMVSRDRMSRRVVGGWTACVLVAGMCLALSTPALAQQGETDDGIGATAAPQPAPGSEPAPAQGGSTVSDGLQRVFGMAGPTGELPPVDPNDPNALAQQPEPMTAWTMFLDAGWVAKLVMIMLILASIWNITIYFDKSILLRKVNRQADRFLKSFRSARSLEDLSREENATAVGPMARMFLAGMEEFHTTADHGMAIRGELRDRIRERIHQAMGIVQSHETRDLGGSMSTLATIGSTAPFIGLFGTVVGIMNSFIGIAQTQQTNLATVAPGIAEALLATAVGLAAAIPAVMLYNKFSRDIGQFAGRLEDFASEFSVVLSRELDQKEAA